MTKIYPIILAGGFGTRLQPLSTREKPKQFLALINEKSMIQNTVERLNGIPNIEKPVILCNLEHLHLVESQLQEINVTAHTIITEPVGRNTAPAITIASLLIQRQEPDAILLILAADHAIKDVEAFQKAIGVAIEQAKLNNLVTFGIKPTHPETGYGYVNFAEELQADAVFRIHKFVEKPDLETAERYLELGDYYWNSGMFVFCATILVAEMQKHAIEIFNSCSEVLAKSRFEKNILFLSKEEFENCPKNSIDYAVMEKTDRGVVVKLDAGWSDIGSWEALLKFKRES